MYISLQGLHCCLKFNLRIIVWWRKESLRNHQKKSFSDFRHLYGVYLKSVESVIPPPATFWVCLKVFEMLVDKNYNVSEQVMQPDNSKLCEDEKNIVDYIGGYVIHSITKHASRLSSSEDKSQILLCVAALTINADETVNTTTAAISKSLTSVLDRGGLKKVNPKSLQIFLCLEFVFRQCFNGQMHILPSDLYFTKCCQSECISSSFYELLYRLMPHR